jgi:hypothetical protein
MNNCLHKQIKQYSLGKIEMNQHTKRKSVIERLYSCIQKMFSLRAVILFKIEQTNGRTRLRKSHSPTLTVTTA